MLLFKEAAYNVWQVVGLPVGDFDCYLTLPLVLIMMCLGLLSSGRLEWNDTLAPSVSGGRVAMDEVDVSSCDGVPGLVVMEDALDSGMGMLGEWGMTY